MSERRTPASLALSVIVISAALAGCAQPESTAGLAQLVGDRKTIAPGATASFLLEVNVTGNETTSLDVSVAEAAGLEVDHPAEIEAPGNRTVALVVNVSVPEGTGDGERTVRIEVSGDPGRDFVDLPVRVTEPSERVARNQTVQIDYVLRHPNGTIIATSNRAVANSTLPKDPLYRPPRAFEPVNVSTARGAPFAGLADGLVGAGVDTSVSFGLEPWEAPWGNETVREEQPRRTTVNRTSEVPSELSRNRQFVPEVNESSEEGDVVELGPSGVPFEITHLDNTTVNLTIAMAVGDRIAMDLASGQSGLQNPWPDSSELVEIRNDTAEFYTTPPANVSEPFTFFEAFENATTLEEVTEHELVLEHSPSVGLEYEWSSRRGTQTRTVVELTDDAIVYERDNNHPLAGHRTAFDIAVMDAVDTPPPQAP